MQNLAHSLHGCALTLKFKEIYRLRFGPSGAAISAYLSHKETQRIKMFTHFGLGVLAIAGSIIAVPTANATSITVNLGQSAQNYTLTGQGIDNPYGTYFNTQGTCTPGASTTSCVFSGSYTGSTPGFTAGTYQFLTTYANGALPASVSEDPLGGANQDYFEFYSIDPSTSMYLDLAESGGPNYNIPIFTDGVFDGGFSVAYVNPTCSGTSLGEAPCTQIDVGQVAGAIYSGQVTGSATFDSSIVTTPTPEPSSLVLLGTAFLALGSFVGYRRS